MVARGLTLKQIAARMQTTEAAVKNLKKRASDKLGMRGAAVIHHVIEQGWVTLGDVEK